MKDFNKLIIIGLVMSIVIAIIMTLGAISIILYIGISELRNNIAISIFCFTGLFMMIAVILMGGGMILEDIKETK